MFILNQMIPVLRQNEEKTKNTGSCHIVSLIYNMQDSYFGSI